jgi:hypothetical protein
MRPELHSFDGNSAAMADIGVNVTVQNIRSICDMLRCSIVPQKFDQIVATFKPETVQGLAAFHLHRAQAHPLAVEWHELMQAVEKSEIANALLLPERSFFLLDNLVRLKSLLDMPNIDRILNKLNTGREYFSTMFEVFILSSYRQIGSEIQILAESTVPGERSADFLVRANGEACYIECKSLEDMSRKEERLYEQLETQIMRALDDHKRSWRVQIRANRILHGRDISGLVALVVEAIESDDLSGLNSRDGNMSISFQRYTAFPHLWINGTHEDISRTFSRGLVECESATDASGNPHYKNAMIVESEPYVSNDESKRILADINDAHSQIPLGSSGIVHIEIPYKKGTRLLEVSDLAYGRVFGLLKKKRRLNATVLSARTLHADTANGSNPILNYFAIIPNSNPASSLPATFAILGTDSGTMRIQKGSRWSDLKWWWTTIKARFANGISAWPIAVTQTSQLAALGRSDEGTIVIEFGINQPMETQIGKSLLYYSSPDGAKQLRLWQSFANHFRADIVHPNFGRRTFKGDLNHLEVGKLHKAAIGWSAEGVSAAVNGEMLAPLS